MYLKRYVVFGLAGLVLLHVASRNGLSHQGAHPAASGGLVVLTRGDAAGVGVQVNGATRWLGAGPISSSPPSS